MEETRRRFNPITINENTIQLISTPSKANEIIDLILLNDNAVIGVDIEAAIEMSRFGILCLLQIAYKGKAYIFDLVDMSHKDINLNKLFNHPTIIKIFHDCLEDLSLLCNLCHLKNIKGVFDTQIAHRMCNSNDLNQRIKNSTISLDGLLQEYLGVEYELKGEMHEQMAKNPYLWKGRPLSEKLITYAGKDVLYLPTIYEMFKENCMKNVYPNITMSTILQECEKYSNYVSINLKIKSFYRTNLQSKTIIQGLIKNYQKSCVFIQLNIGYIGIVLNEHNVDLLKTSFSLGDIVSFQIVELDMNKKRYVLEVSHTYEREMRDKDKGKEREKERTLMNNNEEPKKCPKLRICVQSFIPQHLKKKSEIPSHPYNYNVNEEEKNVNINNTNKTKQLVSFVKPSNNTTTTFIFHETKLP